VRSLRGAGQGRKTVRARELSSSAERTAYPKPQADERKSQHDVAGDLQERNRGSTVACQLPPQEAERAVRREAAEEPRHRDRPRVTWRERHGDHADEEAADEVHQQRPGVGEHADEARIDCAREKRAKAGACASSCEDPQEHLGVGHEVTMP